MKKFASVCFKHTNNGWRVTFIRDAVPNRYVNGFAYRNTFDDELNITGFVPANLREGQFCKRPHKIIKVKEFRK